MAGSNLLALALSHAWILPFAEPPLIKDDHRLLGLNFNPSILFGGMLVTPTAGTLRGVNSRHEQNVIKFCKQAVCQCHQHQLAEWVNLLMAKTRLNDPDLEELEAINMLLTKILITADKKCRPQDSAPWSLALQQAYLLHCYWSLRRAMLRTKRNLALAIKFLSKYLDPWTIQEDKTMSFSTDLWCMHAKTTKNCQKEADQLWCNHLEALINQVIIANQQKKTKVLKYLIQVENNCQCYAHFQNHTKAKLPGGLAFVTVQHDNGTTQTLLDHDKLEDTLLKYSSTHFAKAKGSPFTNEPLSRLLQYDGIAPFGNHISDGCPVSTLHYFDNPTLAILSNLKQKVLLAPLHYDGRDQEMARMH